ncbi:MAG: hypothetical protein R3B07_34610 [Polyangiaceae bacterium]
MSRKRFAATILSSVFLFGSVYSSDARAQEVIDLDEDTPAKDKKDAKAGKKTATSTSTSMKKGGEQAPTGPANVAGQMTEEAAQGEAVRQEALERSGTRALSRMEWRKTGAANPEQPRGWAEITTWRFRCTD